MNVTYHPFPARLEVSWRTVKVMERDVEDGMTVRDVEERTVCRTIPLPEGTRVSFYFPCLIFLNKGIYVTRSSMRLKPSSIVALNSHIQNCAPHEARRAPQHHSGAVHRGTAVLSPEFWTHGETLIGSPFLA